ncbi:proline-rich protein 36-like [Rhipicephalus sanguineus]|uniref:proline-rich protein 36-like n=1 Tax=Rhipicephalus sanguineus TaxID=34632 RepID=UPI00189337D4|nr:proline-rich protein 36-like [Rhipicephalus sanguineus]
METPAYIPSPEAIHLAAADAASATGAPGARPPRRLSKHKRSPSACDASDVKSTHPLLQKSTFQRWQEEINRQLSRGPLLARQGPPASPAIAAPQATCPVTPDDAATFPLMMNPHQCATAPESSPAVDGEPAAATGTSGDNLPPLPAPTQQEQMDLTSSRKRPRADSSDEEEGPRKVGHSAPSEHDSRDSESSQDSSALQPSEDSEDSCDSTHTSGSSSIESPSPEETTSSSASTAEELTTDSCTEPHSEVTHNTLEAAPPAAAPSPAAVPAAEEVHENQDEGDTMEETAQEQDEDISPPHPSEAFLRSPPRPTTSVNPRRKKRKQKKKGKPKAAQGPSGTTNFPSTSDGIHSRPATTANAGRLPSAPPLALTVATPPASQREDDEGFITPQSKAARRRQKHLSSATLKVDPAVVGTVLFRPSAPGGSFFGIPRLTLAEALSARPGITAIRVNHRRNIVAVDATTRECLESLLALTELRGIPVSGKEPADRRSSTGFLHGVDGEHDDNTLLASLQSSVPVLSAAREGRTVTLRFGGPVPPEQVMLFRVRFPVRPARPRPLQCKQCGRYGHVREACRWPDSCIRCGRAHTADEGCQRPRCVNCGGPHSADTPHCPRWQEQRQVATIMASSTAALSRRMVAAAVREETREARTYASALKGHAPPTRPVPAPRKRHRPPPAHLTAVPEALPARAAVTASPAVAVPLALPAGAALTASPAVAVPLTPPAGAAPLASPAVAAPLAPPAVAVPLAPPAAAATPPVLPPAAPATHSAQPGMDQLRTSLMVCFQLGAAMLPPQHPLQALCLQAMASPQTSDHHG